MTWNLLSDAVFRVRFRDGADRALTLPALYEALAARHIISFTALRAHQRHAWHALLCQIGAVACLRAGLGKPPSDATTWAKILAALTPDFPDGEPWCLVSPPDKPAFLQPVVGPLDGLKPVATPDEFDMLVTAKNHDLKGARMADAQPDDWLFALVSLQTSEGFLGAGNFGISRMNGGFANRPGVGLAPRGGIGAHVMRDIGRLIAMHGEMLDRYTDYDEDGPALLWLLPWDGTASLSRRGLHPYYIETCRRLRLAETGGAIRAFAGNSKAMRVSMTKEEGGVTGDPWTPIRTGAEGNKALTVDARGFDYRRLADILTGEGYEPAPLQKFGEDEGGDGWTLVCRAMARGQGKTEGYHERRELIPAPVIRRLKEGERVALGGVAAGRIAEAGAVRSALRFGLMTLFQNGPDPSDYKPQDPSSSRRAEPYLDQFQRLVDDDFFDRLFEEFSVEPADDALAARKAWLLDLLRRTREILKAAEAGAPTSTMRHHRAMVRAEAALARGFYGSKDLRDYFGGTRNAA
ncbi:MAG: type I-E CRISPR-associated protein Cse1/CasA [Rhizobiaceae bacterium]|nr:type I-E CRISPR-associated protein Cse1/CasA [Rhizobiaceae bacterium]